MRYGSLQSQELIAAFLVGIETCLSIYSPQSQVQGPTSASHIDFGLWTVDFGQHLRFHGAGNQRFAHALFRWTTINSRLAIN